MSAHDITSRSGEQADKISRLEGMDHDCQIAVLPVLATLSHAFIERILYLQKALDTALLII